MTNVFMGLGASFAAVVGTTPIVFPYREEDRVGFSDERVAIDETIRQTWQHYADRGNGATFADFSFLSLDYDVPKLAPTRVVKTKFRWVEAMDPPLFE